MKLFHWVGWNQCLERSEICFLKLVNLKNVKLILAVASHLKLYPQWETEKQKKLSFSQTSTNISNVSKCATPSVPKISVLTLKQLCTKVSITLILGRRVDYLTIQQSTVSREPASSKHYQKLRRNRRRIHSKLA